MCLKENEESNYLKITYNDTVLTVKVIEAKLEVEEILDSKLLCRLFISANTGELEDEFGFEQIYIGIDNDFNDNYLKLNDVDLNKERLEILINDEDESDCYALMYIYTFYEITNNKIIITGSGNKRKLLWTCISDSFAFGHELIHAESKIEINTDIEIIYN